MGTIFGREPAVFLGAVAAAIIAVVNVFIPLDQATKDTINSVVLLVGPIVLGLIIRFFVSPASSSETA